MWCNRCGFAPFAYPELAADLLLMMAVDEAESNGAPSGDDLGFDDVAIHDDDAEEDYVPPAKRRP